MADTVARELNIGIFKTTVSLFIISYANMQVS